MTELRPQRPDPAAVLASLKDFQRRTVEHVYHRLFLDQERTNRFLVADEVGLGKTLIARGVTALALDHLWDRTKRLDVIYVCSNAEIAGQNVRRLRVTRDAYARPTRLTLLPRELRGLKKRKLNFVSLTPGTSFDPQSSMGIGEERAVIYLMLRRPWEFGRSKPPLNVLCADKRRDRFEALVRAIERENDIDEDLAQRFVEALRADEEQKPAAESLRGRFEALLERFARRQRNRADDEARQLQQDLIRDLRALLARTCINALEPDLIILDEFQRFKHLLTSEDEAGKLARYLFDYEDSHTDETAKTLLLSATPYKAYATSAELDAAAHYEDFLATVEFLLDEPAKLRRLRACLDEFRSVLVHWREGAPERLAAVRGEIETILRGVIARTERLAASPDRNGMLTEVPAASTELEVRDLDGYLLAETVAGILEQNEPTEHWKAAPYLLNLMDRYKLKHEFRAALEKPGPKREAIRSALKRHPEGLISWNDIVEYRRLDPANARMRALVCDLLDREAWKLLWLPASLPYYEGAGPYAGEGTQGLTKRLVFSSWAVVPKAVSLVLSYEAERRIMLARDSSAKNTAEARRNRGQLLRITVADERPTGMPVLGLIYPSYALAELVDPVRLAAENGGARLSRAEARDAVAERLRVPLQRVVDPIARASGSRVGVDERWYWAAPLLLDGARDPAAARALIDDPEVVQLPQGDSEAGGDQAWREHLREARRALDGELEPTLGEPPADLLAVLAEIALAAPGVAALRALTRGSKIPFADREALVAAIKVGWGFRSLFNTPEASELIRAVEQGSRVFWQQALAYCVDGCLQAVLDEYVHVLHEYLGHVGPAVSRQAMTDTADAIVGALTTKTTRASIDVVDPSATIEAQRMRARFALRFGKQEAEDDATLARAEHVRGAFNSPFWPFVLCSTSVGQEGLDFHLYCHAVTHWNLPSNPVDLEQREGRVHRYKGHAIRRNLAIAHGEAVLAAGSSDPWAELFRRGEADRPPGGTELWPYWIYCENGDERSAGGGSNRFVGIERHVLALPLSRDQIRLRELQQALTLYRSVIGQARQEDLVRLLAERVPPEERERIGELLRIDLTPPVRPGGSRPVGSTEDRVRTSGN